MSRPTLERLLWTHVNQTDSRKTSRRLAILPAPSPSPRIREIHSNDRRRSRSIPQREETSDGAASVATGGGQNAGAFVMFTKNWDDDPRPPIFRGFGSTNRYGAPPYHQRHKSISQPNPVTHRLSSDWMERLQERGNLLLPEERIAKFG